MLEVEVKFRCRDWQPVQELLSSWGVTGKLSQLETDQYFNAPDRDFAKTDEALRLRTVDSQNVLTYKGPKLEQATKTRKEVELSIADGQNSAETAVELLTSLGYRFVAKVHKRREIWSFSRDEFAMEACFDEVEKVGSFIELEIRAEEQHFQNAKQVLLQVAAELGLQEQERRSYLGMLLQNEDVQK
jgi:adenylate cyclase, class 2